MRSFWQSLVHIDLWLERYRLPIFLLCLVVLLRIPTFFEPYWYGDEGIYLVLGEALNRGRTLYAEIIDHKTPLIYVFAQVGSQLNFRLLMTAWLVGATAALIRIAKQFFANRMSYVVTTLGFIAAISLPTFEGTIPNGELFVIGFVLLGVVFILKTSIWHSNHKEQSNNHDARYLLAAGMLFGLGILTKVPAILDFGAWLVIIALLQLGSLPQFLSDWKKNVLPTALTLVVFSIGVTLPILASILYFALIGESQSYLDFGLLYNFRYAGTWQPDFPHQIFGLLFSLPGKTAILALSLGFTWLISGRISKYWLASVVWFWCALFASLLSNRPYPHYFLQVVPPLALLLGSIVENFMSSRRSSSFVSPTLLLAPIFVSLVSVILLLDVRPYPTVSYYQNWWQYVTNQQTLQQYNQWFNPLMTDNYEAAKLIRLNGAKETFIWGTNPMLYALSDTLPPGRFTVSFHIHDFAAYEETMHALTNQPPQFIILMYDEHGELPGLNQFLLQNYRKYRTFDHYVVWKQNAQ